VNLQADSVCSSLNKGALRRIGMRRIGMRSMASNRTLCPMLFGSDGYQKSLAFLVTVSYDFLEETGSEHGDRCWRNSDFFCYS
jgi:hypothetical protein